ncbi:prophage CP4-57 regulatory [Caballeronia arvi]|uniref:Prophage CP4-57 regulatory n=1 Tax=Caballeronia arvi TaxID=1777135 RepID=A0A158FPX7_9BURK|nr:DNA-binding protein [Caballeronia arvi]SAL21767.1 prophage CP4-57 regulatory [Caballeronia arvi]
MEYVFTLKYRLSAEDCDHEQLVERLAESGCDDATVGIGQPGRLALAFTRDSTTAWSAIFSALVNVKQAIASARLIEAAPDFIGLTDVAEMTGMTRQNMRKLMLANALEFPAPVHEGNPSVWHLSDILAWLNDRGGYDIDADLLDVANAAKQVNLAIGDREVLPQMTRELKKLVA